MSVGTRRVWAVSLMMLAFSWGQLLAQSAAAVKPSSATADDRKPPADKVDDGKPADKVDDNKPPTKSDTLMQELESALQEARVRALTRGLLDKEPDTPDPTPKVIEAYRKVVNDPDSARRVIAGHLADYLANKERAKSAPQASQVAAQTSVELQVIMLVQNQRIIELLEQRARSH